MTQLGKCNVPFPLQSKWSKSKLCICFELGLYQNLPDLTRIKIVWTESTSWASPRVDSSKTETMLPTS
jgi:hypothetical protein